MHRTLPFCFVVLAACSASSRSPDAPPRDPEEAIDVVLPTATASAPPETGDAAPVRTASSAPSKFDAGDELDGDKLKITKPILFDTGKPTLKSVSDEALTDVVAFLGRYPEVAVLRIETHSDNRGSSDFNLALTAQRSLAIAQWLVAKGIDCHRLMPVGFGETRPIHSEPEDPAKNRRVEFHVALLRGESSGGRPLDAGGKMAGDPCQ